MAKPKQTWTLNFTFFDHPGVLLKGIPSSRTWPLTEPSVCVSLQVSMTCLCTVPGVLTNHGFSSLLPQPLVPHADLAPVLSALPRGSEDGQGGCRWGERSHSGSPESPQTAANSPPPRGTLPVVCRHGYGESYQGTQAQMESQGPGSQLSSIKAGHSC